MGMGFGYKFVCRGPCAKHLLQAVAASAATPPDNAKNCNRPDRQPVIIFESAKSAQQITNINYETKSINSCGCRCDRTLRLCRCVRTTGSGRSWVHARPRVRPWASNREVESDI